MLVSQKVDQQKIQYLYILKEYINSENLTACFTVYLLIRQSLV